MTSPSAQRSPNGICGIPPAASRSPISRCARRCAAKSGSTTPVEGCRATAAGHPVLALDIALYEGEVTYGNVGTAERLDFTAVGPVINEATRLEALCKELGRNLLIFDSFVRAAPTLRLQLRSLGLHRLRGVREPREVFTSESG